MENLELLVNQLIKHKNEMNWFEFKCNNYDPEMIGQDISALVLKKSLLQAFHA